MNQMLTISNKYYKYLAQLFSQSVLTSLCHLEQPELIRYVLRDSGYGRSVERGTTFGEFFEGLYKFLSGKYRCEYIYKNTLANQILLDRHAPDISTLLTEFRVDDCKADIVILNGTSSVYEIKTELDSFDRLDRQLKAYRKVFDKIYVVTHKSQIAKVGHLTDEQIGLIYLTEDNALIPVRDATSNRNNIDAGVVFSGLRQNEYCQLILQEYGYIPNVPNTMIYRECMKLAIQLNPSVVHDAVVEILKRRSSSVKVQTALDEVPYSLRLLYLARKFTREQHNNFIKALNLKLKID